MDGYDPTGMDMADADFIVQYAHLLPNSVSFKEVFDFIRAQKPLIPDQSDEAQVIAMYDYVASIFSLQTAPADGTTTGGEPTTTDPDPSFGWGSAVAPHSVTYAELLNFLIHRLGDETPGFVHEAYHNVYSLPETERV